MYETTQEKDRNTRLIMSFFAVIFLADEALLPVFHFGGIPFKMSYLLAAAWIGCNLFHIRVFKNLSFNIEYKSDTAKILWGFWALIAISFLSELTMLVFSKQANTQPFFDGILYYLYIIGAIGLGYSLWKMNPKIFVWVLYGYCLLNIAMLMFYSSLPGFVRSLYGEYYATGIRIRGTGGNANTTLLVMNMIFMAVIMMVHKGLLKLKGIHLWLVMLLPLLTNFFVSSRGEFLQTLVLEVVLLYVIAKKDENKMRVIGRLVVIAILVFLVYQLVFNYLYYINDNIRYGIDRLQTLTNMSESDTEGVDVDGFSRPFLRADVFWARFKHSPIWGAGYSYGTAADFVKSVNGYHNDWFRVLASVGVIGFGIWVINMKKIVSTVGVYVLIPFFLASLSNTFLQSTHAINIYFFAIGIVLHWTQEDHRKNQEQTNEEMRTYHE